MAVNPRAVMERNKQLIAEQRKFEGRSNIDWVLYDSLKMSASARQTLTFFQQTIGAVGIARTNMRNAGMLPSPQSMIVEGIGVEFFNLDGSPLLATADKATGAVTCAVAAMAAQGGLSFNIDPATEYEAHLSDFFNFPLVGMNNNGAADIVGFGGGFESTKRIKRLNVPLLLDENRSFNVKIELTTPAAGNGFTAANTICMVKLYGSLRRNK